MGLRAFRAAVLAVVTCAGVIAVGQAPAFAATPVVILRSVSGQPGSTVTVSGGGFTPGEAVDVYFDTTDEALVTANSGGGFGGVPVSVPASATPGIHYISAVGRHSDLGGQSGFVVSTNWGQYRDGPRHQGDNSTENVLSPSNVPGMDMAWSFATGNNIDSSPAVANLPTVKCNPKCTVVPVPNEMVYVGSTDDNLYAIHAATGALAWKFPTGGAVEASPAVVNGLVYAGSDDGNVYALIASSGSKAWSFAAGSPVSSPVVSNGVVYVAGESTGLYALNASNGAELWHFAPDALLEASPAVANGRVYIGASNDDVYALSAATGDELWSYTTGNTALWPAVAYGKVYVGSYDGNIYALNASNGNKVWSFATGDGGSCQSAPAIANGVVYVGSCQANVYALNASNGNELWTADTGGIVESSPAVANGVVYIGSTDDNVYAFSAATGAQLWNFTTGDIVRSSPAVANGTVYVGSNDGNVYAFNLAGGEQAPRRPVPGDLHPDYALHPRAAKE